MKYRYIGDDPRRIQINGREVAIEKGDLIDIPESAGYVQVGDHNEVPLFERATPPKAASPQKEDD